MQKIRTFWHVLRHSLIPFDYYYHKLRTTAMSFSLRYFLMLVMVTVIFTTTAQYLAFVTVFPKPRLQSLIQTLSLSYPKDLIVTITPQGRLTTNYDKPYILFSPLSSNPMPLVVIDPKAQMDMIDDYDTPVLMTEGHIYTKVGDQIRSFDYEKEDPIKITSTTFNQILHVLSHSLKYYWLSILVLYLGGIIFVSGFVLISHIFLALVTSCITWVIYAILFQTHQSRKMISLGKLIQIAFHTMTAPLIIACIFVITPLTSSLPHWYISMNILLLCGGVYEAYFAKKETHLS